MLALVQQGATEYMCLTKGELEHTANKEEFTEIASST